MANREFTVRMRTVRILDPSEYTYIKDTTHTVLAIIYGIILSLAGLGILFHVIFFWGTLYNWEDIVPGGFCFLLCIIPGISFFIHSRNHNVKKCISREGYDENS